MQYNFDILEQRLNKYINDNMVSGLSVAIIKDNQIVFDKCFGDATKDTVFRLASLTKPITAVAMLVCQDKGLLNINNYIDKYIPYLKDFHVENKDGVYRITIRQLLNHSSGFPTSGFEDKRFINNDFSLENVVKTYKDFVLQSIPGEKETYSNEAYDVVARIIEIVSGLKYEDFLKKYIFDPLGMVNTTYRVDERNDKYVSKITEYKDGQLLPSKTNIYGFEMHPNGFNGGGAGLLSTVHDYLKFANALTYGGEGLLSTKSFEELINLHDNPHYINVFGLGVHVRSGYEWEHLPAGSFGWSGAYGPHYFSIPKEKITVVYMHNSLSFGGAGAIHNYDLEDDICKIFGLKC